MLLPFRERRFPVLREWPGEAEPERDLCFDSSMDSFLPSRDLEEKDEEKRECNYWGVF
jgi:hypothetical protein